MYHKDKLAQCIANKFLPLMLAALWIQKPGSRHAAHRIESPKTEEAVSAGKMSVHSSG